MTVDELIETLTRVQARGFGKAQVVFPNPTYFGIPSHKRVTGMVVIHLGLNILDEKEGDGEYEVRLS